MENPYLANEDSSVRTHDKFPRDFWQEGHDSRDAEVAEKDTDIAEMIIVLREFVFVLSSHIESSNDPFIHLGEFDVTDRLARTALAKHT